jgi:hypothetical protein
MTTRQPTETPGPVTLGTNLAMILAQHIIGLWIESGVTLIADHQLAHLDPESRQRLHNALRCIGSQLTTEEGHRLWTRAS